MKQLELRIDAGQADAIVDGLRIAALSGDTVERCNQWIEMAEWVSWRRIKMYGARPAVTSSAINAAWPESVPDQSSARCAKCGRPFAELSPDCTMSRTHEIMTAQV